MCTGSCTECTHCVVCSSNVQVKHNHEYHVEIVRKLLKFYILMCSPLIANRNHDFYELEDPSNIHDLRKVQ